jgi:Predicted membrane protein
MTNILDLIARILISFVFFLSGIRKIINYENTVIWMDEFGVPGFFLIPAIILEILAPLLIVIGYKVRISAILLSLFCIVTAMIFLNDLPNQIVGFSKNIALAGGFLFLTINGAKDFSLDKKLSK